MEGMDRGNGRKYAGREQIEGMKGEDAGIEYIEGK